MKLKIYNIAAAAFIGLMFCSLVNYAQQEPRPAKPAKPTAPTQATQATTITVAPHASYSESSSYSTNEPYTVVPGANGNAYSLSGTNNVYTFSNGSSFSAYGQDTAYTKKMQKLQDKMNELRKQMTELRTDEVKRVTAINRERTVARAAEMRRKSDSSFTRSFSRAPRFNYGKPDENLQKQVESGEVKEKDKTYTKSYPADKNDQLQIDNTYGNITVNTWEKNEFKVDVVIKVYTLDDADTQRLLDATAITDSKEGDIVKFKTMLEQTGRNWGTSIVNGQLTMMRKVVVTYTVFMPAKSALTIKNNYGAIVLPNLDGKLNIANNYGSLLAKSLNNADNVIHLNYVDANIASLAGSDLKIAYGTLKLDAADNLNLNLQYTPAQIGKLSTAATIKASYGDGVRIADLDKNLKTLSVSSTYAPIRLNVNPTINADFDVTVGYTDFTYSDKAVNVTSKSPDNEMNYSSTKNYKGHIGKGAADKVITIKENYGGGVKFE